MKQYSLHEVKTKKEYHAFFTFPFSLYRDCNQWVPPITNEEKAIFNRAKNPVFENAEAKLFVVKNGKQIVGRIAALINWIEVKEQGKTKVRFGWYDTIDDLDVSRMLINAVHSWGKQNGLTYLEGPMGFSNMDKAGVLVQGYEYKNTMITWYHYPYQMKHLKDMGLVKQAEWVEFKIKIFKAEDAPEKVKKYAELISKRYELSALEFSTRKELLPYVDKMFDLLNKTYNNLQSFVPIQPYQIAHYKKKYFTYIHPRFIKCVADKSGNLIAFAITMPSFSEALKKMNGSLYPFGFLHIMRALRKNNRASFYLIGIDPAYQNKGVTAILFDAIQKMFNAQGITDVETNPELEENNSIQLMWKNYEHELHKRRRTYKKDIS
ncbi:GNAT family N-acetyltransferase [Flavobacteriaceae bacterium]|nr:GNAT family N-acetyltransferase [Flavobacteriaceae bacterium]